jgi:hypothetical protein
MAWDIHPEYLRAIRGPRNWRGIYRHKLRRLINWKRSKQQKSIVRERVKLPLTSNLGSHVVSSSFEQTKEFFNSFGYAYIPDFFLPDSYSKVLAAWPELPFFRIKADPSKSYDRGPTLSDFETQRILGVSPNFYACLEYIASKWFCQRVSNYCADGIPRVCSSIGSSWARVGSHLLPHKDNAAKHGDDTVVNFIIFVDGSSPAIHSGGTSLFRSNTYVDPVLIPSTLRNSALVYGTGRQLHHGFPRLKMRKYSKRIIAQFSPIDISSNH